MPTSAARDLVRVPSLLSLSRLAFAIVFVLTVRKDPIWPIAVLVLAGASDVLDGWYARRFGQVTPAGAVLDAVMDKVFVALVAIALVLSGRLSTLHALLLGVRDLGEVLIGARLAARDSRELVRPHAPHPFGKLTTLLQFGAAVLAVLRSELTAVAVAGAAVSGALATLAYWRREAHASGATPHSDRQAPRP